MTVRQDASGPTPPLREMVDAQDLTEEAPKVEDSGRQDQHRGLAGARAFVSSRTIALTSVALAAFAAFAITACTTTPPPVEPIVARPVPPQPPVVIVQPVKPEPPPPVVVPPAPEPQKVNEEAEEALAVLADLQKLVLAGSDEQRRELAAAAQSLSRQKSDAVRLRLAMLQSLPAGGADEARALATLDPILKQGTGPTRMVAVVLTAQIVERQRAIREEKKRSDDLQQKLEALKALERSLLGRERKPTSAP